MGKKRFKANTEVLPSNYDDFFNKVYQDGNKYKDLSDNIFDKTETRRLDFDSHNQDELTGNENPFTSQFGNPNAEDPYNEYRANNQSALNQAGVGAVRTVAKAATEIAKLPGVIGGIGIMAADGLTGGNLVAENEGFETAFNNQWIKYFDGLNENVKEALPVYIKESVKNGDFFTKIGSSAFYATEGADGAGFMLGALAPGALFKMFGGANALFGASIKAAKLAKYGEGMEAGRKAMQAAGITIKNIDQYMIPAFNTLSEAGAESKGVWDGMESRKGEAHDEYMSKLNPNDPRYQSAISLKNEELDQLRRSGEISIEEYNQQSANVGNIVAEEMFEKDFKEQKALAAQNSFFKNVVVLAGPNYIQAKLLFGKTPSKVLLDKIGGLGEKSIKNTVKQGIKNFAEGFLSEGAEEVAQTAIENRNKEQGLKFKLGNDRGDDYNPLTFGDDFIKTLGTTEGQMAGFLGGIMGAPMSAYGGYKQDVEDRVTTERLREKINGASTAYADIKNTNIYEQEEYTNPETGEVGFRDREVDGKKVFIPENVAKVKKALDLIEKDSNEYDNAVEDGDIEKIEQFRNRGEFNVISNFIGEDEVTLDALHEHLKVAFPTETSKDISDEQVKINKTNLERIDKIMSKAKSLQKDFVSFKDMSASILRINHPDITKNSTKEEKKAANEHLEDFLNRVGNTFLSERAEEYEAKQSLNKLEKQRLELENNSTVVEIDNPNYIEGVSSEFDKKTKTRSNNPRLELVNSLIDKVKEKLKGYEENTNNNIWNNELLNKQFAEEVKEINGIKKENTTEQVAKNDEVLDKTKNATTVDEVKEIEKTSPKETVENPIIKKAIADKKAEIIQAEKVANETQIAEATQEDNDFNDTTVYTDLTGTEGSPVTDDLIPEEDSNSTAEEIKKVKNEEVVISYGAQVISSYLKDDDKGEYKSGETIPFMLTQYEPYLKYEKTPINKAGKEVGFEINTNPGVNKNLNIALKMLEDKDFSNPAFLISYLPINVIFEKGIKAPMETRRANGKLDSKKDKDGKDQFYINPATETLRSQIINHLVNGGSINDIKTTIQDQYKGLLKVDDNRFANNNILELDGVTNLKYVRDNLYVVNSFGNLMNIQSGKTKTFSNHKIKPNAAGEIYLMIPQANGSEFPLKLNIKKINESEAVLLYEIYKEIITNEKSLNTTISETNPELQEAILKSFEAELNIIGGNKNDIKLQEIVDLLIYQSDNIKSRMQIENGVLYFGENEANINNIEESQNAIINYLVDSKRHQIKINPKFATDNTKTNLKSNNADYLKYLIDNNILSTNAVVNEPTFQGYTNIYLNTGITVENKNSEKIDNKFSLENKSTNEIYADNAKRAFIDGKLKAFNLDSNSVVLQTNGVRVINGFKDNNNTEDFEESRVLLTKEERKILSEIEADKEFGDTGTNIIQKKRELVKEILQRSLLNQPKVSEQGVEINTNNFEGLNFGDKKVTTQPITGLSITYTPTGKQTQTYTIDKTKIFNSKGEEVFKEDSADRRKIFANVAVKEGRAKVIEDNKGIKYVVNNKQQIMSTTTGKIMEWAENHATRKLLIDKYNSSIQPKVSESGVEVKTDNTGFDEMFNTSEMGDDVLDILKEFETEPKVENKVLNKIKSFTKNDIESQKEKLGLQNVKFLYEPSQGSPNFTIILKGDNFDILTFFEKGQWSIFPKQPNGEFQASDPKTGNALFLNPEKRKEVVVKYVPKELIKLLEDADKVKGLLEQDKFMEGDIKKYLYLYEKENLKLQLDYAEDNLRIFESPNYPNKDSQERIIEAQKESIKTLKEKLANLENKSENTRNVQENFLSLSEIKGTVENKQLNETQSEVFKENKIPPTATEMRLINKAITVYQEDASKLTEAQKKRLEEYATNYPESWKKICK
jgi:hypothetical protein